MLRTLRAFAWLRWRVFVNSLEHTGARDRLERFSIAVEQIGPIMAAVFTIPSVVALAGLGAAGGYMLAKGTGRPMLLEIARYLLLAATGFSFVGPLLMPTGDRTNPIRLLLLPISRRTLYVAQSAAAITDVWVLLAMALVFSLPLGLIAGGAPLQAIAAVGGAVLFACILAGLTALATTAMYLLVRDRRRSELIALAFIVLLPLFGMLPGLMSARRHAAEGGRPRHQPPPAWVQATARAAFGLAPSELYLATTGFRAGERTPSPAAPLLELIAISAVLHGFGLFLFGKALDLPGSTHIRKARASRAVWGRTLPTLSPGASAVALAQLRLAMRTSRGRSALLSPVFVFFVFAIVIRRAGSMDFGFTTLEGGLGAATFGVFLSLIVMLPILMNQFAVDGAGLTLSLLSPLSDREFLRGKAAGNALIVLIPMTLCFVMSLALFHVGSPALWISIPLSAFATYAIVAPFAAIFSAVFPRAVDMSSIGGRSNAHGLAGLLGMLSLAAGIAPCAFLVFVASTVLRRPALTPVLLLGWCAAAFVVSSALSVPAERVLRRRRENLGLAVAAERRS